MGSGINAGNDEAEAATAEKAATPTAGNDEAEAATAGAATPTAAHGRAETAAAATNATKEGRRAIPQHYPECPGSRRYHRLAAAAAATAGAAKYLHRLHRLLHSPEWLN